MVYVLGVPSPKIPAYILSNTGLTMPACISSAANRAETFHVGPLGNLVRHQPVVGEGLPRVLPQFQLGAFAHPSVMEVGDDEEPGFHPSAHGLAQTVDDRRKLAVEGTVTRS